MDVLIVEPLEPEVMHWLVARHAVRYAPDLARDPRAFRQSLFNVRSLIIPPSVSMDSQALHYAPVLRAVGRLSSGAENIDTDACARAGVEVVEVPRGGDVTWHGPGQVVGYPVIPVADHDDGPDALEMAIRLAAEMLRGGTTCCNDMYFFPDATARALLAVGMRAMLAGTLANFMTATIAGFLL